MFVFLESILDQPLSYFDTATLIALRKGRSKQRGRRWDSVMARHYAEKADRSPDEGFDHETSPPEGERDEAQNMNGSCLHGRMDLSTRSAISL